MFASAGSIPESCSPVVLFKRFICALFEQLNSNWQGISIPPHSCIQCRPRPITSTLISPLRARKHHAIRENSRCKWPTVSSSFTTFTACLSIGLLNSRLATSFSPIDPDFPRQINAWLLSNRFVAFSSALFSFHSSIFISTVGFSNEENCCLSQEMGKLIKENLLKGIFRVD